MRSHTRKMRSSRRSGAIFSACSELLESRWFLSFTPVITVVNASSYTTETIGGHTVYEVERGNSFHVNATSTSMASGDLTKSEISWDFGDYQPGTQTLNTGAQYNNLPGFNAGHVYDTTTTGSPGYNTVTVTITDKTGDTETASVYVAVVANARDNDNTSSTQNKIYVGQTTNTTGDGKDPNNPVTWARGQTLLSTLGGDTSVLFRRGDTIVAQTDGGSPTKLPWHVSLNNVLFADYGDANAAEPLIEIPTDASDTTEAFYAQKPTDSSSSPSQIRFENLHILALEGSNVDGVAIRPFGTNIVVDHVSMENVVSALVDDKGTGAGVNPDTEVQGLIVMNCDTGLDAGGIAKPLKQYFYFGQGNNIALLGNKMGDPRDDHNVRLYYMTDSLIYKNDVRNIHDGTSTDTNTLRINKGSYTWWADNTIHGGSMTITRISADPITYTVDNAVIEGNIQLVDGDTARGALQRLIIGQNVTYVSVRNNYLESYDEPIIKTTDNASSIDIFDNTGSTTGTIHKGAFLETNGTSSGISLVNNLYVAPTTTVGSGFGFAVNSYSATQSEFTTVNGNYWDVTSTPTTSTVFNTSGGKIALAAWNAKTPVLTDYAGAVSLDSSYRPTTSNADVASPFTNDAEVLTDFYGAARPSVAPWTAGAVELAYVSEDVGTVTQGTTSVVTDGSAYDVTGGGGTASDISGTADGFRFAHTQLTGDFDIQARVNSMTAVTGTLNSTAKAALMVRKDNTAGSIDVAIAVTPSGFKFIHRDSTGGSTTIQTTGTVSFPNAWIRLRRSGNVFAGYYSTDGTNWTEFGRTTNASMPSTSLVGMAVACNNISGDLTKAQFTGVSLAGGSFGTLTIFRLPGTNTFSLGTSGSDMTSTVNSNSLTYPTSAFSSVVVQSTTGNDTLTTNVPSTIPVRFIGGTGSDTLNVTGGSYAFSSDASGDTSSLTITSAGNITFGSTQHLAGLTVTGGTVAMSASSGTDYVLVTNALSISSPGKVDLSNNDMVVDYTGGSVLGSWNGSAYTGVTGNIASGRNGGSWNGSGLVTSQSSAIAPNILTTLGVAEASATLALAPGQTTLWNGVTVDATAVLVKYTYNGDATLDGRINADDYDELDSHNGQTGTGYQGGDIDYSGHVDGDDYTIVDANFTAQGSPL